MKYEVTRSVSDRRYALERERLYNIEDADANKNVGTVLCMPKVAKWLEENLNRKKIDSEAHKEAARANGKKGGRPRKEDRAKLRFAANADTGLE